MFLACLFVCLHASEAVGGTYRKSGTASYYNRKFDGRRTSNGDRLDNHNYTGAHPSLPFGTLVRVTNQKNGKSVVVRINDRFYPRRDHLIDITYSAARDIDMISQGVARVTLEVLDSTEAEAQYIIPPDTINCKLPAPRVVFPPVPVDNSLPLVLRH